MSTRPDDAGNGAGSRRSRGHAWQIYGALGAILVGVYFVVPDGLGRDVIYDGLALAAVLATLVGIRWHRPRVTLPWWLLAAALALLLAGDLTWGVYEWWGHVEVPFPSVADALYLAAYPCLAAALLLLGRRRGAGGGDLIDAAIVGTGYGVLAWVFLLAPSLTDSSVPWLDRAVSAAYPGADIAVVAAAALLVLGPGARPPGFLLLAGGAAIWVVADVIYAREVLAETYVGGELLDAGWLLAYVAWGAAALHPSMASVARPEPARRLRLTTRRQTLLAGAALAGPVLLIVERGGDEVTIAVLAGATALIFHLVMLRLRGLVRSLEAGEAVLARERDLLSLLMDSLPDQISFKDADLRYVRVNRASAESWGIADPAEAVGKTDFDFPPADHAAAFEADDRAVLASGEPLVNRLEPYTAPNGETRWLLTSKAPIHDAAGRSVGIVGVARDVTDFHRAEEALQASEERLRLALAAAQMGTWDWDLATDVLEWSEATARQLGKAPSGGRVTYADFLAVLHPDDRAAVDAHVRATLAAGDDYAAEYRTRLPDGTVRWNQAIGRVERDAAGNAIRLRGVALDVTARKQAESALRATERRYRELFDDAPVMYVVTRDRDGAVVVADCNRLFLETLGYERDQIVGRLLDDFYTPASRHALRSGYQAALRGEFATEERELVGRDGRVAPALLRAVPDRDDSGRVVGTRAMFVDLTERKRAEEELAQERDLLHALMDNVPDLVYFKDRQSRFVRLNEPAARNLGCPDPALAVGKSDVDFFPDDGPAWVEEEQRVLRDGEALVNRMVEHVTETGERRWLLNTKVPLRDRTGQIVGLVGVGRDVTERRESEERLREAEARYRALVEQLPAVVYIETEDGAPLYVSPQALDVLGRSPADMMAVPDAWLASIHPEDRPRIDAVYAELARSDAPWDEVYRCVRPDGRVVWIHDQARLVHDVDGSPRYWQGIMQDVTAQKETEAALRTSEARYRDLFDHAPVMHIVGRDEPGGPVIVDCNDLFLTTLGYRRDEVIGRPLADLYAGESRAALLGGDYALPGGEQVIDRERRLVAKDGRLVDTLVRLRKESDLNGLGSGAIAAYVDVTELKRIQQELRAAKEAAEESSRRKTEFLSMVSHELRTPMTSIRGYVELLQDGEAGELTVDQRAFLDVVGNNTRRLTALLNDVLDLAKIDAGRLDVRSEPVCLAKAIEQVRVELAPQATAKGIALRVRAPVTAHALADPDRLHQVLVNLIGNAVKFTDRGAVEVAVRPEGDRLAIAVVDTGIGIAPEHLPLIFDEYRQADGSATRRFGGTGLGLAIARKLAEAQGGSITVESRVGAGSTFTLWLPTVNALARTG